MNRFGRRLALAAVAAGVLGATGVAHGGCFQRIEESATEEIRHPATPRLKIRLDEGALRVTGGVGDEFRITIRRTAEGLSAEAARSLLGALAVETRVGDDGETFEIQGRRTGGFAFRAAQRLRLAVTVETPAGAAVDIRTGNGTVFLSGLTGPVRAVAVDGRITAERLRAPAGSGAPPIRLRTATGRIEGKDLEGRIHAEAGDGRIRLAGRLVEVTARSGDGDVAVEVLPGTGPPTGDWRLRSADGTVSLRLAESADARVEVFGRRLADDGPGEIGWTRLGPTAVATIGAGRGARIRVDAEEGARIRVLPAP